MRRFGGPRAGLRAGGPPSTGMVLSKLIGGLTALGILLATLGALAGLAPTLASQPAALVVFLVVVAVTGAVCAGGLSGRRTPGNPYW